jgi:TetR/AcrR family transcriptional repressor of cmeABC operon
LTPQSLKSVALHLFARNGYEGTSLADIAERVGIKKPSIYAHFKGKEDLFLAVFEDVVWEQVQLVKQLAEMTGKADAEQKLLLILRESCRYFIDNEDKATLLKRFMLFPPDHLKESVQRKFLESEQAMTELLAAIFAEGIKRGEIQQKPLEELLAAYYCLLDGLFIQLSYYGTKDFESRLHHVWNIYWSGIAAGPCTKG